MNIIFEQALKLEDLKKFKLSYTLQIKKTPL